jgi:cobalt-zinc-cadmium resistance protein CzcA
MIGKIIQFSVQNKLIIGLLTLALVVWGAYSFTKLPIDAVPDITNNQVQVITNSPSLGAEEIERLITFPLEKNISTIPGITELRSFSRFGLSVVTVVFTDETDVYWARQQVSERMGQASSEIPSYAGKPELAPVTTGLGEIYQYILKPKRGFEKKYNITELRSIQDWIIKRQLLGTEGVAEVSSFGGFIKQYEISVDPQRLRSFNLSLTDLFKALEENNQNTGGAYIEKNKQAWYIRSEGLIENLDDIAQIQISNSTNGLPILLKDIAEVKFGHATRYGAMTSDEDGETVGAIVLMLKGENSSKVIERVKANIAEIQKSMPEGIEIKPYLDRTKLVDHAIGTVSKNLLEGALIVILVLVLLLGNLRAGFIVASVIPLALLFAVSLMNLFGVSGNLMSLGALDFGLIVDGAVIIIEATLHHLYLRRNYINKYSSQEVYNHEVIQSAAPIRQSAAFGELIILIVYLPILALSGVEGKMFKPMAQTVSFAIIGAFILSLTYVPMMASLLIRVKETDKETWSDRLIHKLQHIYEPLLRKALLKVKPILLISLVLFIGTIALFTQLGGEFIPTLEEGDFAVEMRVTTGSSLEASKDAATLASGILRKQFPEVKTVVAKIGSSEIPVDPMPIEACDLIIVLKDREEWVSASSREEMAEKMSEALAVIPGVAFGFQQPIQMRFNELMTGARQDVVVKIYGEELDELSNQANKLASLVGQVKGAQDIYIEQSKGAPQIVVKPNRKELARYNISVNTLNLALQTAFAGAIAGKVYEAERGFDLVIRLNKTNRQDIGDVQKLYITAPSGLQVPLTQLAEIKEVAGVSQLQRDHARRRVTVGFNVRERDIESVVHELRSKVAKSMHLLPGYSITYGGTFENLREARNRMMIYVPLSLILILVALYFTFGSLAQGLLIFSAIPLSTIGGVLALWLRGMPFSISAGVGFIALFGVAVLNGIVLLFYFNQLKKQGVHNIYDRVIKGAANRLRPVLMTAAVASLGFLPMAISMGAGAEVQKPLATVVIGGLISSTLLTLFVLPALYVFFNREPKSEK